MRGLDIGRQIAMRTAYTTRTRGPRYNAAFQQWLDEHPDLRMTSYTRTWLYKCMANEREIVEWRRTQPNAQYLSDPETVYKRWSDDTQGTSFFTVTDADVRIARLQQEKADLQRRLDAALEDIGRYDGPSMTRTDTTASQIRALIDWFPPTRLIRVGDAVTASGRQWEHERDIARAAGQPIPAARPVSSAPTRTARTRRPALPALPPPRPAVRRTVRVTATQVREWQRAAARHRTPDGPRFTRGN
jgi:hypothetical protein